MKSENLVWLVYCALFSSFLSVVIIVAHLLLPYEPIDKAERIVDSILSSPQANARLFFQNGALIVSAGNQALEKAQKRAYMESIKQNVHDIVPLDLKLRPQLGSGPHSLIFYTDFSCSKCARYEEVIGQFLNSPQSENTTLIFKFLPSETDLPNQLVRWILASARLNKSKAFALSRKIFHNQTDIFNPNTPHQSKRFLYAATLEVGLSPDQVEATLDKFSAEIDGIMAADLAEFTRLGLTGTPAVVIDNKIIAPGFLPYDVFLEVLEMVHSLQS